MAWNEKYWDIHEEFYWTPGFIGLESIKKARCTVSDSGACLNADLLQSGRSVYARSRTVDALRGHLHEQEEILNHIFDIAFAIAPDELIREALISQVGFSDHGPFESLGRDIWRRYGWAPSENVTQHDGYFVSEKSALAVELKLRARSSLGQIAKYIALIAWEEMRFGPKEHIGLLYIVPEKALKSHWRSCGLERPVIEDAVLPRMMSEKLPRKVMELFLQEADTVGSVARRLRLAVISWTHFFDTIKALQERLDPRIVGEQTLHRLIDGLLDQLKAHRHTGLPHG